MDLGLKNKSVLITGGATGIGRACALAFLKEGCRVSLCGRTKAKVDAAVQDFKNQGYDVFGGAVDAAKSEEITAFAAAVAKEHGGIDVWLNNAGIYPQRSLLAMTEDEWDETVRINLKSVFLGTRIATDNMRRQGGGVIINASSFAAVIPSAGSCAYAATKAAIGSLTRTSAAELAPYNIRVVAYIPGMIRTEMTEAILVDRSKVLAEQAALNRLGEAEDLAGPIVFLASQQAAFITGVSVEISGGKFCVQNPMYAWPSK
ncbi:MAG: SDR family NAD(P)-dependent oxidoreductase [Negativicutes bacterium]|nr:SDR family NAD(P)-dependent oxidoreductase [Negativicutes bacterium]